MSRTYVITGAASGVGKATKEKLEAQGHTVIGIDLKGSDIDADLSTPAGRQEAVAQVGERTEVVDAVIASAGISSPIALTAAVNYFGVTQVLEGLHPLLTKSDAPRAAVVSSMASLQPNSPELVEALLSDDEDAAMKVAKSLEEQGQQIGQLNYSSSKRAISRWVRREAITEKWAGEGIPLNAVGPGVILTPMTDRLLASPESKAFVDAAVPMPLNYHQGPEVIADLLIWLTSEQNTHCAGQTIYCDGGADAVLRGDDVWSALDKD